MAEVLRHANIDENTPGSKDQLRKTKKPLMEKRRRARINSCLNDIKSLLLQAFNKDGSQFSKLEKADILEMTVKYLRSVQQAQFSAAIQTDQAVTSRYRAGFTECAKETLRYVDNPHVSEGLRSRLTNHLNTCVQAINSCPPTPVTPVYVQIPSYTVREQSPSHYLVPQSTTKPLRARTPESICTVALPKKEFQDSPVSPNVSHLLQLVHSPIEQSYESQSHICNSVGSASPSCSSYSSPRADNESPICNISPCSSPVTRPSPHRVSPVRRGPQFEFSVNSKLCRDVVCTERGYTSQTSPHSCHVRSISPSEPVWRPW